MDIVFLEYKEEEGKKNLYILDEHWDKFKEVIEKGGEQLNLKIIFERYNLMEINLKRQLTTFEWLQFPLEVKAMFKETFNIPRSAGTIVTGNVVQSDGHTNEDLSRVSLQSLQEYLGTTEDHWDKLLQLTINKMENPNDITSVTIEEPGVANDESIVVQGTTSKAGRGKKAKKTT